MGASKRAGARVGGRALVVLQSVRLDVAEKSYMNHVADALRESDIKLVSFSYRTALFGRWDVLHVHWPEAMARHHRPIRRAMAAVAMLMLLARIAMGRKPVLRTVHNQAPHERGSGVEAWLVSALDRHTTGSVLLNPFSTPIRATVDHVTFLIPHGHYRELVTEMPYPVASAEFRVLYFGFLKPYKRVEDLLESFAPLSSPRLRLRLVGRATPQLSALATQASSVDPRVTASLDFMSDEQLSDELGGANLVVLPYHDPHNSGAALHALSANRPILVSDNPVMRWIDQEVGPGWVHFFRPPLDSAQLEAAIEEVGDLSYPHRAHFDDRDWSHVASRYADAYREVASRPGRFHLVAAPSGGSAAPGDGRRSERDEF